MTSVLSWEEATLARLREAREKKEHAQTEFQYWEKFVAALEQVVELDQARRTIPLNGQHRLDPEKLRQKSIRQVLIEIGAKNNGMLVATEAVKLLVEAGLYADAKRASPTVYSVLKRSKKDFRRERAGVYRLVSQQPTPLELNT